jgi:hypothetical protein
MRRRNWWGSRLVGDWPVGTPSSHVDIKTT